MRCSRLVLPFLLLVLGLALCRPQGSGSVMGASAQVALILAEVEDESEFSSELLLTGAEMVCFWDGLLGDGYGPLFSPAVADFRFALRENRAAEVCAKLRRHRWLRMEHC